jgi:predicted amidohydrolase YtcJ
VRESNERGARVGGRVFVNGNIFDGRRHERGCAVAVRDGRIVAVGEPSEVREHAGPGAEEVDLAGGLLAPGFQDAHIHPMIGGLEQTRCDLSSCSTREEYLDAIAKHAAEHPGDGWFRGGGWSLAAFEGEAPTVEALDRLVPDRPAFLPSSDHHDAWVNSRALEAAGVTAETPDPPDGWMLRSEDGRLEGTLREAAMALVGDHLTTTREEYADALRHAQRYLHSHGITGWQDALLGGYAGIDDPIPAYLDLLERGELPSRVRGALWWDRHRGVEQIEDLVERRAELARHGLDTGSIKMMADGISETGTCAVTEPYLDPPFCPCGDRGLAFLSTEQFAEAVEAADRAGFQVHVHAIGDRAVHDALDAIEHARRVNGMNDLRHQIAHLQLVRPEDRPRFRRLGVVANLEGLWANPDTPAVQLLEPHLGEERITWQYPFADIADHGGLFAGGSDWPVNTPDPVSAIHALVNRRAPGSDSRSRALIPGQALTLSQAFATYTSGSSFVNHRDDTGHLQVGALADLVVLDRDPFLHPAEEISEASVVATYLDGEPVHTG